MNYLAEKFLWLLRYLVSEKKNQGWKCKVNKHKAVVGAKDTKKDPEETIYGWIPRPQSHPPPSFNFFGVKQSVLLYFTVGPKFPAATRADSPDVSQAKALFGTIVGTWRRLVISEPTCKGWRAVHLCLHLAVFGCRRRCRRRAAVFFGLWRDCGHCLGQGVLLRVGAIWWQKSFTLWIFDTSHFVFLLVLQNQWKIWGLEKLGFTSAWRLFPCLSNLFCLFVDFCSHLWKSWSRYFIFLLIMGKYNGAATYFNRDQIESNLSVSTWIPKVPWECPL